MRSRLALALLLCAVMLPGLASAEKMILEAQPKVTTTPAAEADLCDIFTVCSLWHEVYPVNCTIWHVIYCGPALPEMPNQTLGADRFAGPILTLQNRDETRQVRVERVAPQYRLRSGAVVEPQGAWNPNDAAGESWSEVKSGGLLVFQVVRWDDVDGDGLVGTGDRVAFDNGSDSVIESVRLGIHVEDLKADRSQ